MSMQERRKQRREASRAALRSVAAAPSFKKVRKQRVKRSPLRRGLIAATFAVVMIGAVVGLPKQSKASGLPPAPEIDASSMAGAMTLLVGGFLALTDRARRS